MKCVKAICTICQKPVWVPGWTYEDFTLGSGGYRAAQEALVAHHKKNHPRRWRKHHRQSSW